MSPARVAGYVMREQEAIFASIEVFRHRQHRKTDKSSDLSPPSSQPCHR
jgi:hypothetical protein